MANSELSDRRVALTAFLTVLRFQNSQFGQGMVGWSPLLLFSLLLSRFPQSCESGLLELNGIYEISARVKFEKSCTLRGSPGTSPLVLQNRG